MLRKSRTRAFQSFLLLLTGVFALALPLTSVFAENFPNVEFKREGNAVNELSVDELRRLAPEVSLKVFEVHEKQNRVYRVLPARAVFDKVFGKDWEQAQEVVFISIDGYQPSVPVKKFLAHNAYFAFANADDTPFTLTNRLQNNEVVPLGPLYLVWDNIGSNVLLEAGASDMPYQIRAVELKFKAPFPNIVPQSGAASEVQRGFSHFRQHCAACHTINGDGGAKAPELNYPASVVEYIKPEYLKRWIMAPQSIRYNTTMPGLGEEISNREKVTEEIIVYLKAMSTIKRVPESVKPVENQ
ncbi:Cytochrome c, mono- and diheme variants [Nitrosovibrio sp. Nv4]|nr:Cytochrome c, mono- and diheme variants [Nitrosovibrio sp. Nv4]